MKKAKIKWAKLPEKKHYTAAATYLDLVYKDHSVDELTQSLRLAKVTSFKAKDIFRASSLPLLSIDNLHVKKNYLKLLGGDKISPLLLVRDKENRCVIVADGYHRLCAVYALDEDANVCCKIA